MDKQRLSDQHIPIPKVTHGKIERIENLKSKYVSPRHVDIWLPETYSPSGNYSVIYMHDGQMLYDESITWNHQSWDVSNVLSDLMRTGKIRECIVVGIWNSDGGRHSDYFPKKPFDLLSAEYRDFLAQSVKHGDVRIFSTDIQSDNYLKFIVEELKPQIDREYATLPDMENTFISGSSMGGLISMYAICEYPEIFSGAACLSTHWIGITAQENNPIPDAFVEYISENLPDPANHRIYFDYGTEALDAFYEPHQLRVDEVMKSRGYDQTNWRTMKFDGDDHSELSWRKRLHLPMTFLLQP